MKNLSQEPPVCSDICGLALRSGLNRHVDRRVTLRRFCGFSRAVQIHVWREDVPIHPVDVIRKFLRRKLQQDTAGLGFGSAPSQVQK